MRILACADIHGSEDVYTWLASVVIERRPEVLVLAGDLFGFPDGYPTVETAQQAQGEKITDIICKAQVPILYIMGNDDWIEWAPDSSLIQSIHGRRIQYESMSFVGYQFTPPFVGSIHEKPETDIRFDLDELAPLIDRDTVMVTHGPARHYLDKTAAGDFVGSCALSDFFASHHVHAHIHGHIHRAFGRHLNHFNVAAAATRRAMLIDLDTMQHEVVRG